MNKKKPKSSKTYKNAIHDLINYLRIKAKLNNRIVLRIKTFEMNKNKRHDEGEITYKFVRD